MFIFLSITCPFLKGQVIDYGIDPEFNTGMYFYRGGISDLLFLEESNTVNVRCNLFNAIETPVTSGALISADGEFLQTLNYGGPSVAAYKNSFLQNGNVVRMYNLNGIVDSFRFEFQKPAYSGSLSNYARNAFSTPDDHIIVSGRFFTDSLNTDDVATLRQLCMVDSTGKPDPEFPMLHCAEPFNAEVYSIDTLSTGAFILAGRFEECNGRTYHNVIKLNPDFSVDTTFTNSLVFRSYARLLFIDSEDRIYLNTTYGGLQSNPQDTVTFLRLLPNGELDPTFQIPDFRYEFPESPGSFNVGAIGDVIRDTDGTLVLAGWFTEFNGHVRNGLVKIMDDGTVVEEVFEGLGADAATWGSWSATVKSIWKIQQLSDGKLLLGGTFSSFGGEAYSCLVKLMPNGYVGVDETEKNIDLQVYPNPTTGWMKLAGADVSYVESVELYNLSGQVISLPNGNLSDGNIDLSDVPNGIYILAIYTSSEKLCRKVVKY